MPDIAQHPPLLAYHTRTKHRFEGFAHGPGHLDWNTQPEPFRHYPGAALFELPLAADGHERPYGHLHQAPSTAILADLNSLGTLLELSLGISAWKSWGTSRWALRCNPSSGNLHPVEAYVLSAGLPGVADGLHHYDPRDHQLEGRALRPADGSSWLAIGLSSIMWREAWKYGERAFRYCQLDVGHAIGALSYAAALLGWQVEARALPGDTLAHLLGLDRTNDGSPALHAHTESEEPEILLAIHAPGLGSVPASLDAWLSAAPWHGTPSRIAPESATRWPLVEQAATASRLPAVPAGATAPASFPERPPLPEHPGPRGAMQIIRQRRSAQDFDPHYTLDKASFYRLLDATLPRPQAPFTAHEGPPAIHLLLFVLRVDGLPSGLYLLPRTPEAAVTLPAVLGATDQRFAGQCPVANSDPDCPAHLGLVLLAPLALPEMQRLARALSCHQDIAATSAFSLGMLGDLAAVADDAYAYRRLLREAGLVGQVLYLEAEAAGVRGTGIGCFFDDPVHHTFGIADPRWQSVYHFTVGTPLIDKRIETSPPYPRRQPEKA